MRTTTIGDVKVLLPDLEPDDLDTTTDLADGLTEALIQELSEVKPLQVISRNGVAPFKGKTIGADSVAVELTDHGDPTDGDRNDALAELAAAGRKAARRVEATYVQPWLAHATPQPLRTWTQPLSLKNPAREELPKLLITCSVPLAQVREMIAAGHPWFAALAGPQWSFRELPTGHWPMFSVPDELATLLADLPSERPGSAT